MPIPTTLGNLILMESSKNYNQLIRYDWKAVLSDTAALYTEFCPGDAAGSMTIISTQFLPEAPCSVASLD